MMGLEFTRNQKLALIAIVGLIAIGVSVKLVRNSASPVYGGIVLNEAGQGSDGVNVVTSDSDSTRPGSDSGKVIFQVAGCVNSPNVFSLPKGSRIVDAIKAAGGLKPGADIQSLNLAAKIEDGSRILIPSTQGNAGSTTAVAPQTASVTGSARSSTEGKAGSKSSSVEKFHNPGDGVVNINTADATELQRLPGVGPSTAQTILDYRSQIRRFSSAEQLDDVKGIGPKKLEKMKPFVTL